MDREVMAVDSEFSLDLQNDGHLLQGLMEACAKKGNIYETFLLGNAKTLKEIPESQGIQIRDELLKFYRLVSRYRIRSVFGL